MQPTVVSTGCIPIAELQLGGCPYRVNVELLPKAVQEVGILPLSLLAARPLHQHGVTHFRCTGRHFMLLSEEGGQPWKWRCAVLSGNGHAKVCRQ
jgi:hypothetical protein